MRAILVFAFVLLLQACAHVPQQAAAPINRQDVERSFVLNGRIAVNHHGQRSTVNLRWVHTPGSNDILLLALLGITVAHIEHTEKGVLLEANGKQYRSHDVETLMDEVIGWHLPLDEMYTWALAHPYPGSPFKVESNTDQQIVWLQQDGWEIRYPRYQSTAADSLPSKLLFRHNDLDLQLVVDEWELGSHD